jgi:hypothetical protein
MVQLIQLNYPLSWPFDIPFWNIKTLRSQNATLKATEDHFFMKLGFYETDDQNGNNRAKNPSDTRPESDARQ